MELSRQREFLSPEPGDDWDAIARRVLPDLAPGEALAKLESWNLHLFARNPPGAFTGCDVVFVEAPLQEGGDLLALPADGEGG